MLLQYLELTHFKAYKKAQLNFTNRVVAFTGPNGAGKTNLLDAIHYLCIGKSYFNPTDQQNIRHGENFLRLKGKLEIEPGEVKEIVCVYEPGKRKRIEVDKVAVAKLSEHFGQYPLVVIAPDDIDIVNGGSEGRRRFLDFTMAFADHQYIDQLNTYNKLLAQRNQLLKQSAQQGKLDEVLLETYDTKLAPMAKAIHEVRASFVKEFLPIFQEMHDSIVHGKESLDMVYDSELTGQSFLELMQANREADKALQRTTTGVHRDDITLSLGEYELKKYGSQGQKKSALIALKLAQYQFLEAHTGRTPLLLLDDLFDKLDNERVTQLLDLIGQGRFGQVFITDTEAERVADILGKLPVEFDTFEIRDGAVQNA